MNPNVKLDSFYKSLKILAKLTTRSPLYKVTVIILSLKWIRVDVSTISYVLDISSFHSIFVLYRHICLSERQ